MKLGISRGTLNKRIGEEQQAQRDYKKNAAEARSKGDTKTAKVITHIKREEHEHEGMLKGLKGKSMKHNPSQSAVQDSPAGRQFPKPSVAPKVIADEIDLGTQTISAERSLNQGSNDDAGAHEHAQEALRASLETGLGNENFRSKGGDKSSYAPDSSTGKVLRY